jgi:N utilization substance protein B
MASRRKGRILAFQALYCWESTGIPPETLTDFSWLGENWQNLDAEIAAFARLLLAGTVENVGQIDSMIKRHLKNWDISRLNRVDFAILHMSVYALMYQKDMPPSVVIDEAIGIAKEFGADDSYRFVNGVLDGIRKTLVLEQGG